MFLSLDKRTIPLSLFLSEMVKVKRKFYYKKQKKKGYYIS